LDAHRLMELYNQLDSMRNDRIKLEAQTPIIDSDPNSVFRLLMPQAGVAVDEKNDAAKDGERPAAGQIQKQAVISPITPATYFDLQKRRDLLLLKRETARAIYRDKHPLVGQLNEEISLLSVQMAQEVQRVVEQFRTQVATLKLQEQRLKEEIET